MAQGIFLIQQNGTLVELKAQAYDSESILQELLAKYPGVISGNQSDEEHPHRWLLVKREMGIGDGEMNGDRWSLDHLFLDQDGVPTLVEVKRSADTRIRREVVGQMLDYAANAVAYWPLEKIQALVESASLGEGAEADVLLNEFLGEEADIDEFWQRVKANLASGRVRLVFVADQFPRELIRIIEFLNQQMSPAEVYGIEVKQFVGRGVKSLVPRIVGVTASAEIKKSGASGGKYYWNEENFLEYLSQRGEKDEAEFAKHVLDWAKSRGDLRLVWSTAAKKGSVFPMRDVPGKPPLYTFRLVSGWKNAYIEMQFSNYKKPFETHKNRLELAKRVTQVTGISIPAEKYPSIQLVALDTGKLRAFLEVMDWYLAECLAAQKKGGG